MSPVLTDTMLDELAARAASVGVPRLSAVALDDPRFGRAAAAFDRFVDEQRHGEMNYLPRTAEVRKDPSRMLPGARSLVVAAVPYRGEAGPVARYAQARDYHNVLHERLEPVAAHLRQRLPEAKTLVCVDTKPVMERAAAALAGLGFIGKHGCVIVPGLGSYVVLGCILTTAIYSSAGSDEATRVLWDACGSCRRCLDACPTDAFDAPGELDPRRCISYLTIEHRGPIRDELADRMGERVAGCDVCQEVCPYNATAGRSAAELDEAWLDPPPPNALAADLAVLSNIKSNPYKRFIRGTALRRIPRRSMRRNALLALGNRAGELSSAERESVESAEADPDPQIRAAAARARRR